MRNSLPYYNKLNALPSLFMFLDTSSSSNGTMDGWSFYIFTFQSVLYLSVFTYMNLSLVRERTEWEQIKISLTGINNDNLLTTCCTQYILPSYFVHYPVFQKQHSTEKWLCSHSQVKQQWVTYTIGSDRKSYSQHLDNLCYFNH